MKQVLNCLCTECLPPLLIVKLIWKRRVMGDYHARCCERLGLQCPCLLDPIKVLDKDKKGETHRGYYWVYHNSIDGLVLFDYQMGRGREGPKGVLKDFKGHLQTDGYSAYDFFKEDDSGITVLHCMAHARRKFYEALSNDKVRAEHALTQIGKLYDIERRAKEWSDEQRLALRKENKLTQMSGTGVRRDKAALSSGCKPHPAIRSSRKQPEQAWRRRNV